MLLYQLLKVAFSGPGWLVQVGNVVQLGYLFLVIVQVGRSWELRGVAVVWWDANCASLTVGSDPRSSSLT